MSLDKLDLPSNVLNILKKKYVDLNIHQNNAIDAGLLNYKNILAAIPQGSGKTLIATLAILKHLANSKKKIVYLVPLNTLAEEKYQDLLDFNKLELCGRLPKIVKISRENNTTPDPLNGDVIFMTNEMFYQIIKQDFEWVDKISLIIFDELYLINEPERGSILEILITIMKQFTNVKQIICLGPILKNANKVAQWLDAELISGEDNMTKVRKGVYDQGRITMDNNEIIMIDKITGNSAIDVSLDVIRKNLQVLLFVPSIKKSITLANEISQYVYPHIDGDTIKKLKSISDQILKYGDADEQIINLSQYIKCGVAFHNANLNDYCQKTIEQNYRNGNIKIIVSTPTLSVGVNLPAYRVVISEMQPWRNGKKYIPLHEYDQMCGRSGRFGYHSCGDAIAISDNDSQKIRDDYMYQNGIILNSKIINDDLWQRFIINILHFRPGLKMDGIKQFFKNTLNGKQYFDKIDSSAQEYVESLIKYNLVTYNDGYHVTPFGIIVSTNIMEPKISCALHDDLVDFPKVETHTIGLLFIISKYMRYEKPSPSHNDLLLKIIEKHDKSWFTIKIDNCSINFIAVYMWINGTSESNIKKHLQPHYIDLKYIKYMSKKICHDMIKIINYLGYSTLSDEIFKLGKRIEYGVNLKLLDLIRIRISPDQAQKLYDNDIKSLEELNAISESQLKELCGFSSHTSSMIKQKLNSGAIC